MDDTLTRDLFEDDADENIAPIESHASQAYLSYAVSTVKARALPEVADGLKPVQRRILYAMHAAGGQGFAKCARYVGEVLGKYHPHGDSSTYEALVHLAQPFSMRYPLIEGQGNFGSRDGDSAAAYRYTEARLARYAELMLAEIDEGTVDFQKNYDGKFDEPVLLPARLPFGLLNGSFGIPVGFSTRIPSHNLSEVAQAAIAVIRNPKASVDDVLAVMPGPDYPGGGQIISRPDELRAAYETGRGSITMRARWTVEQLARGQWQIVVTELPHTTSARQVQEEIQALVEPKPSSGRKDVSPEQKRTRQFILDLVETVRDESDRRSKLRLVIEPRSSRQSVEETVAALLVHTSLETKIPINMTWIGLDGFPDQKGIVAILREWTDFRIVTVHRRTEYRLQKCQDRLHIVEGRIKAFAHIDEIIKVIRASEDVASARAALMARWKFTERQAQDICDLRLGQLTRLDGIKLNDERKSLQAERDEYNRILGSDRALRSLVVKELEQDAKKYGDPRRSAIESAERASIERSVVEEPVTVILSQRGWIRARNGHDIDMNAVSFKDGDERFVEIECKTTDPLVLLGQSGKTYTLAVASLPTGRGDGVPVNTLISSDRDTIVWIGTGDAQTLLLLHTSAGNGFVCKLGDMVSRMKAGKEFLSVPEGAQVLPALRLWRSDAAPKGSSDYWLAALSSDARLLLFRLAEVPTRSNGGLGVTLLALPQGMQLASLAVTDGRTLVVSGERRGKVVDEALGAQVLKEHMGKRAQRGRVLDARLKAPRLIAPLYG
ncbi:MAG: DNA topoisomerase IV subunit A [Betaproteobacteria bacterium]|nr:DNA topoisomerase IV subunit A [Betaproteobacteria bacterium]